jgi:hypothetical protein
MIKKHIVLITLIFLLTCLLGCRKDGLKKQILVKIKSASDLATLKFKMRKILYVKKNNKLFLFKLPSSFYVATIEPEIEAGIDLSLIKESDISIDHENNLIKIEMPAVKIIQYDYNEDEIKNHWDYTADNILNRLKLEDYENIHVQADNDIRMYLNHIGIRQEIENSVRRFFGKFFEKTMYSCELNFNKKDPLIYVDYEINILEGDYSR